MLIENGHEVGIAATGTALELLKHEYPDLKFYHLKDYNSPYTKKGFSVLKVVSLLPLMVLAIRRERRKVRKIIRDEGYDLVISDNRFGINAKDVPSIFISHQLRYSVPFQIELIEKITERFNGIFLKKFDRIVIPDNPPEVGALSGKLANTGIPITKRRGYHAGILASIKKLDIKKDIDYLVSVSGPDVQKAALRDSILSQIKEIPGKKVILLGDPGADTEEMLDEDTLLKSYAGRHEMSELMNRAKFMITRSGYTTVMELVELGKKDALFIPTPGQTEQEYLSEYYEEMGWFHSVNQKDIDLKRDIALAKATKGPPPMSRSYKNAKRLYKDVLFGYLPERKKHFTEK